VGRVSCSNIEAFYSEWRLRGGEILLFASMRAKARICGGLGWSRGVVIWLVLGAVAVSGCESERAGVQTRRDNRETAVLTRMG
jgi:hypothetical protein